MKCHPHCGKSYIEMKIELKSRNKTITEELKYYSKQPT